nr:type I restriction enzyme HsdR N-terminal domain-containing protein [Spirulina sp. 06S082]
MTREFFNRENRIAIAYLSKMPQLITPQEITLRILKQTTGLQPSPSRQFFPEWTQECPSLSDRDRETLDRVKTNFSELMEDPPMLENSVKMVVLAPLLDLAGFYRRPFRLETETSIAIELQDQDILIQGRIDILVLKDRLWLAVIESKRSDFAATRALPQTLAYMLGNPDKEHPTFGMITNGSEFLFLKTHYTPNPQYATSRLLSLINPENELYEVLAILKHLARL